MKSYDDLAQYLRESAHLASVGNIVAWDHETYMPPGGAAARAEQSALVARLIHERQSSPELGDLIAACEQEVGVESNSVECADIREARRDFDKRTRVPADLVSRLAEARAHAQHAWKDARERGDFAAFRPKLDAVLDLTRERAECLNQTAGGELYNALLDEYEPGMTAAEVEAVFTPLKRDLTELIREINDNGTPPTTDVLTRPVPAAKQEAFGRFVAEACGFSFKRGRLDVTTHPFCEGVGPGDTRMTTRYREDSWTDSLYGIMHEMGHGLYEQGLPRGEAHGAGDVPDRFGLPSGEAVSLGMNESQSRLWENAVGRSVHFWRFALPKAKELLGDAVADQTPESLAAAVNTCAPTLIRVEADEGTYNLHVMIRFELERALISGDLSTADLPAAWNDAYKQSLGLDVPNDREGCLQDVHWSFGLIGYFPTYTLGNLHMAAQWNAVKRDIPDLNDRIERGEFAELLGWLRTNLHRHGRRYPAAELTKRATGSDLSADALVEHLRGTLLPNYGLEHAGQSEGAS
ncbi:MAG: carboxypeptidase M32 [Planctomycetota bacterium]